MKCRKCNNTAAINMRQHKLALCKGHFLDWLVGQTQRFIHKYHMFSHEDNLLVSVSGGKDSLALWDILIRLGYKADGLYIGLGIEEGINYSSYSEQLCKEFASKYNTRLIVVNIAEQYGESIPQLALKSNRAKDKPCSVCGLIKRHVMNFVARESHYDVLLTGHNLDDEAAVLFGNTLYWKPGYLHRQWPVLEANRPGVIRKAKPLCRFYEKEMAAYTFLRGIKYIYEECPFASGAKSIYYKGFLNTLEANQPGTKLQFYLSFLQAKAGGLFAENADPEIEAIHACLSCGSPTSAPGECAFCRLVKTDH